VLILKLVTLDELDDQVELITLVNLNGHESLDLGSNQLGKTFFQTNDSKVLHDLIVVFLLFLKIGDFVDLLALAKSSLKTFSPEELNTKK